MKNKKKKAFTLVELLAVIVILAVILVIAIPQIMNTIKTARLSSIKDSAMLIAEQAEKDYLSQQVLNQEYNASSIPCTDVAKLNDDYSSCSITYSNGIATVKLKGKDGGKFSGITCKGTKDNMNCSESDGTIIAAKNEDVEEYLANLLDEETTTIGCTGTGKLIKVTHENGDVDYRYVGACPNNYVRFNNETWRIVGIFDTQKEINGPKERRVKLVRNDSLGDYSWDSSATGINGGYGINEWSQADLMNELNGDYLNTSLVTNPKWYNASNDKKTTTFLKRNVLNSYAQSLIENAVWYTGGVSNVSSLSMQYASERGNGTGKTCTSGTYCNDSVTRTLSWVGKVGLIYPSDYAYASEDVTCRDNLAGSEYPCKNNNWLFTGKNYWTISPCAANSSANYAMYIMYNGRISNSEVSGNFNVRPSVYLKTDIKITGEGTKEKPYTFSK